MNPKKITRDDLTNQVFAHKYFYDDLLVICVITLYGGFKLVGHSACLNDADYVRSTGEKIAYERAIEKLYELEGFHRLKSR